MMAFLHRHPWVVTLASIAVVLAAWAIATYTGAVSDLLLPTPDELWEGAADLVLNGYKGYSLGGHIGISLLRVALGFGFGSLIGTLLGLGMGVSPRLDALAAPFIEFLRPLPQLAYLVLLIIWFGIGETPKIILLFLAALPVSAVAARDGVRNVAPERVLAAQSLGASRGQIFLHVVLPSALGEIFIGARLSIGIVYATLIAAEMIAGANGIGWLILDAGRFLRSDYVIAGILIIAVMGIGLDRGLLIAQRRLVHWAGK
ncbi:MAG TPA: ABC transporter permease [Acidisoma sp.]|jgi:taurine transport system permease protein|nr:ABC transporter permease [Acidisoma sp.]